MSIGMGSDVRSLRVWSLAVLVIALAANGCGGSSATASESSPDETARAYVAAVNARDGETVCDLMVDAAAYEFRIPGWGECPKFVSAYIGYQEDSGSPVFRGAQILDVREGERTGELRSLRLRIELDREGGQEILDDILWLVEEDGGWRLARPSGLLYAAFGANVPDDVLEAPDLSARKRAYEQKVAAEHERQAAEDASFGEPGGDAFDCVGSQTSYDDARGDLHFEGNRELTPEEAKRYASADARRVQVATEGDDLCVRITLGDNKIEEGLTIRFDLYSPKRNPTYLGPELELFLDVQPDGRARLAYEELGEEDEYGRHPFVPVSSRIGREGDALSFRVAREDLLEVAKGGAVPEWDGFLWGGIVFYRVSLEGRVRAVSDDVHGYLAMISHPGGKVYESGARQTRDLPTD
jgi:hypothetical protein